MADLLGHSFLHSHLGPLNHLSQLVTEVLHGLGAVLFDSLPRFDELAEDEGVLKERYFGGRRYFEHKSVACYILIDFFDVVGGKLIQKFDDVLFLLLALRGCLRRVVELILKEDVIDGRNIVALAGGELHELSCLLFPIQHEIIIGGKLCACIYSKIHKYIQT